MNSGVTQGPSPAIIVNRVQPGTRWNVSGYNNTTTFVKAQKQAAQALKPPSKRDLTGRNFKRQNLVRRMLLPRRTELLWDEVLDKL